LQMDALKEMAEQTRRLMNETGKRLARLGYWMIRHDMREKAAAFLGIAHDSAWMSYFDAGLPDGLRPIEVHAFRSATKIRKLIIESYRRLYQRMAGYEEQFRDFEAECRAVNVNIDTFHKNFDLMTILNFMKGLDLETVEKSRVLGENFTAEELASVEESLRFRAVSSADSRLSEPLSLPPPGRVEGFLADAAAEVFRKSESEARSLLEKNRY
jgi:hypothetical protein